MKGYVRDIARRKVSDFIRLEHGKVGNRSMLTAAALISASSLAAMLLAPAPEASAAGYCGGVWCNKAVCCVGALGDYHCVDNPIPGLTCWGL